MSNEASFANSLAEYLFERDVHWDSALNLPSGSRSR